jgi:predicted kinase
MSKSHRAMHDGNKVVYATLAKAVDAKHEAARLRGDRLRQQLRIYKVPGGWCLTKMRKGQLV